ncbi:hypothetical protein A4G18_08885 [Pasteurellaceae bacterium Pebbles2]|nr:hypothetical protein [Pasteurellaceae bacterium Pebbles2]
MLHSLKKALSKCGIFCAIFFFSTFSLAEIKVASPIALPQNPVGQIKQIAADVELGLVAVNKQGELWQYQQNWQKLTSGFSPNSLISVGFGRIAGVDPQGHFIEWNNKNQQLTNTNIALSPSAGMVQLAFATIAVNKQQKLIRIEGTQISAQRDDVQLLPDSRPLLVNLQNQDHIAVLASPDSSYAHGILGDSLEAKAIYYVERHNLQDLAEPMILSGDNVFEANELQSVGVNGKQQLVTVISGTGARLAVLAVENGKFTIKYESERLPDHRWLSPFVLNNQIYTVQMPHLRGELLQHSYPNVGQSKSLGTGFSNHAIGTREMNLAANTANSAWLPDISYQHLAVVNSQGVKHSQINLPARIISSRSNGVKAWFLLENGLVYQAED